MRKSSVVLLVTLVGLAGGAAARDRDGDGGLRQRCRAEARMIGTSGKGSIAAADRMRDLRREHFASCMKGG